MSQSKKKEKRLFGTDGIRDQANYGKLTVDNIARIGVGLAEYVKDTVTPNNGRANKILIGKDTRRSSYMIEQALTSGFLSRGVDVMLVGPMPTPSISHLVRSFALDMGLMITASHNPYQDNGIKVFDNHGVKPDDDIELEIEAYILDKVHKPQDTLGRAKRIEDVSGRYVEFVKSIVDNVELTGLKIVVDCANGAAYKVAPTVFSELGATVIPIGIQPDGYNINDKCGSQFTESLQKIVVEENADLGIALDGDADRLILVDENGTEVDGDIIAGIIATYLKKKKLLAGNTIVMTEYSNLALDEYLHKNDIDIEKVINGDREIAQVCREKGYIFGGEQSGHFIFFEHTETGDGTLSALYMMRILKEEKKKLSQLSTIFKKYPQEILNIEVTVKPPLDSIPAFAKLSNKWAKVFSGNGRIFCRYSGTQNILRIMIEAKDTKLLKEAKEEFLREVPDMF